MGKKFNAAPALAFIQSEREQGQQAIEEHQAQASQGVTEHAEPTEQEQPKTQGAKTIYREAEPKTKRVQLLVQPSTYTRLQAKADSLGVSVNEVINRAIKEYIKEN